MTLAILFWVLMIVWMVFGFWQRRAEPFANWGGGYILDFVLFAIIGWAVFGAPVK